MAYSKKVTLRRLKTWGVCKEAKDAFVAKYRKDGKSTVLEVVQAIWRKRSWTGFRRNDWAAEVLNQALPRRLYNEWAYECRRAKTNNFRNLDLKYARLFDEM